MRTTYWWSFATIEKPRAIDALFSEFTSFVSFIDNQHHVLWRYDALEELCLFARLCALDVIDQWDAPGVVRTWLETGEESLRPEAFFAAKAGSNIAFASSQTQWAALAAESTTDRGRHQIRLIVSSSKYAAQATTQNTTRESMLAARSEQNITLESLLISGATHRGLM